VLSQARRVAPATLEAAGRDEGLGGVVAGGKVGLGPKRRELGGQQRGHRRQRGHHVVHLADGVAGEDAAGALAVAHPDAVHVDVAARAQQQRGRGGHVLEVAADREAQPLPEFAAGDLAPAVQVASVKGAAQQGRAVAQPGAGRAGKGVEVQLAAQSVLELEALAHGAEVAQNQVRCLKAFEAGLQFPHAAGQQQVVRVEEPDVVALGGIQQGVAGHAEAAVLGVAQQPDLRRVPRSQLGGEAVAAVGRAILQHQHLNAFDAVLQHRGQALGQEGAAGWREVTGRPEFGAGAVARCGWPTPGAPPA
jgi:hypothetical protein